MYPSLRDHDGPFISLNDYGERIYETRHTPRGSSSVVQYSRLLD